MSVRNHIKLVWLVLTNRMRIEIRKHPLEGSLPQETESTDMPTHELDSTRLPGEGRDYVATDEGSARSRSASR